MKAALWSAAEGFFICSGANIDPLTALRGGCYSVGMAKDRDHE